MSNFQESSQNVWLEDGHLLRGELFNVDGDTVDSWIDLNDFIGNNDGSFEWGGVNFSDSASDISFQFEHGQPILRAILSEVDGDPEYRDINLAERVGNNNGVFYFD